jgi:hypothetical protein
LFAPNKKSHFVASHQKCWCHVRAMVDCQKISLANQIAALLRHVTSHAPLRMTVSRDRLACATPTNESSRCLPFFCLWQKLTLM